MTQKRFRKIKASALLIAMVIGVIVSATLFSLVAATNQYIKIAGQSRDGKIAYQAALSGIEDGLLRYRYAAAQGKTNLVYRKFDHTTSGTFDKFTVDAFTSAYYNLSIRADSVSVGDISGALNWYSNATNAQSQKALPLLSDDTLEFDLTYMVKEAAIPINQIEIQFSNPFQLNNGVYSPLANYFSAVSYQLIDYSARGEEQIISEAINRDPSGHSVSVTGLSKCSIGSVQCRLRITPRVANTVASTNLSVSNTNRFSGSTGSSNKYIFIKIASSVAGQPTITPQSYKPGTVVIEAIGVSGEAKRKVQAQIDSSSGKYLGLFDFGVYCGDKCEMP